MAAESWASSEAVRNTMRGNTRRDTKPELALRRALHALGLRYRVDAPPLPGVRRRADVLFTRARVAVYLDGCFWHGCPQHYKPPRGPNAEYWSAKVGRNSVRDRATDTLLREAGYVVVRVWEHEEVQQAAQHIVAVVRDRRRVVDADQTPPGTR